MPPKNMQELLAQQKDGGEQKPATIADIEREDPKLGRQLRIDKLAHEIADTEKGHRGCYSSAYMNICREKAEVILKKKGAVK